MTENDMPVNIEEILRYFKELVGNQAQEIAVLRSVIHNLQTSASTEAVKTPKA
jgi:hypothetical protein